MTSEGRDASDLFIYLDAVKQTAVHNIKDGGDHSAPQ